MEGGGRAAKHTQSWEEWWRVAGGQPSTLRAGRSGGGGREVQPNTLRAGRSGGGGREGSQTSLKSREEWWRGPGGQPNTL